MRAASSASALGGVVGRVVATGWTGSVDPETADPSMERRPSIASAVGKPQTVQ